MTPVLLALVQLTWLGTHWLPTTRRPPPIRMSADNSAAELTKLKSTLLGLVEDGFSADVLAPLEAKIAALESKVATVDALPPLTDDQRRIWDLSDKIDDVLNEGVNSDAQSQEEADAYAKQRLTVLRNERKFLLRNMLRSNKEDYSFMTVILSQRSSTIPEADFPSVLGIAMTSPNAIERGLAAADEAAQAAETAAWAREREALAAADEAAAVEAQNELAAAAAANVDLVFARSFLVSEEERFGLPHRQVGKEMWNEAQDSARIRNFGDFLTSLKQGGGLNAALPSVQRIDPVVKAWVKEAAGDDEVERFSLWAGQTVEERFAEAWSDRKAFLTAWKDNVPMPVEYDAPAIDENLSPVGRIRQRGAASDSMSRMPDVDGGDDKVAKINKWFNDFLDGK